MRFTNDGTTIWATDLSTHSECEHRTLLEMAVALRKWDRPGQSEIRTELLEMRGREHVYVLRQQGAADRYGVGWTAVLQLCVYTELLTNVQERAPEYDLHCTSRKSLPAAPAGSSPFAM